MEESDDALHLRAELLEHFGAEHPVIVECDQLIRVQRFKRKLPSKG